MIVCILLFSGCVVQKKEDKLKFKKIEITGGLLTPVFSSDNYEYTLYFEKNVNQIILGYEMEDGYEANIEQGEKYIYDGEEIKLYVKNGAEKGKEYIIKCKENKETLFKKFSLKSGDKVYNGLINENEIIVDIPDDIDLTKLKAEYETTGTGVEVFINQEKQISGVNENSYIKDIVYTLKDKSGYEKNYCIKIATSINNIDGYIYNKNEDMIKWFTLFVKSGEVYEDGFMMGENYVGDFYKKVEHYELNGETLIKKEKEEYIPTGKKIYIKVSFEIYDKFKIQKVGTPELKLGDKIKLEAYSPQIFKVNLDENSSYTTKLINGNLGYSMNLYDKTMNLLYKENIGASAKEINYYNLNKGEYYIRLETGIGNVGIELKFDKSSNFKEIIDGDTLNINTGDSINYNFKSKLDKECYYIFEHNMAVVDESNSYFIYSNERIFNKNSDNTNYDYKYRNKFTNLIKSDENQNYYITIPNVINNRDISVKMKKINLETLEKDGNSHKIELSSTLHSNFYKLDLKLGKTYIIKVIDKNIDINLSNTEVLSYIYTMSNIDFGEELTKSGGKTVITPNKDETYFLSVLNKNYGGNITVNIKEIDNSSYVENGGFKIVNSWGIGSWEHVNDGFYYVTYQAAKNMGRVYVLEPDTSYNPILLAVLNISGERKNTSIEISNGEITKEIKFGRSNTSTAGTLPNNNFVVDLTEFYYSGKSIKLSVNNGEIKGERAINYFALELYNGKELIKKKVCSILPLEKEPLVCTISLADILLDKRINRRLNQNNVGIIRYKADNQVKKESFCGKNKEYKEISIYNKDFNRGTGLIVDESRENNNKNIFKMDSKKIINIKTIRNTLSSKVDLSATKYFPPIGNQLKQGSCVAWSMAYYITTYNYAKERNIDLTGVQFDSGKNIFSANNNYIISPAFIYNLGNNGLDSGMVADDAFELMSEFGSCSWEKQPYKENDYYTLGSEEAWRDALKQKAFSYRYMGYIDVKDDTDIEAMKKLLSDGYMLSYGINSYQFLDLNSEDILTSIYFDNIHINHMNTIVGYNDEIIGKIK